MASAARDLAASLANEFAAAKLNRRGAPRSRI
jgi:hypothetical protein